MTIVGRITKDATVQVAGSERKVVNFSIAINDSYQPKGAAERVNTTTFVNCGYWLSEKMAAYLKKGTLVELTGRLYVNAYAGSDGTAKASLNCHVSRIKIHAWPKDVQDPVTAASSQANSTEEETPF
jgi:single-strand DNA-binding protein